MGLTASDPGASPVTEILPRSLPALAWALRAAQTETTGIAAALVDLRDPVQVYRVQGETVAAEADSASHAVRHTVERLRRLGSAYGEWNPFDAAAYFDLTQPQAGLIVQVAERVAAVHVTLYVDLLLPSFRQALETWATVYIPAWQRIDESGEAHEAYFGQGQPLLARHVQHAAAVIQHARRLLLSDIGYLAANAANEERWRWMLPSTSPAGLDPALLPDPQSVPTLTITADFPLPLARQPERQRRLRRHRARRTWSEQRHTRRRSGRSPD